MKELTDDIKNLLRRVDGPYDVSPHEIGRVYVATLNRIVEEDLAISENKKFIAYRMVTSKMVKYMQSRSFRTDRRGDHNKAFHRSYLNNLLVIVSEIDDIRKEAEGE